MSSIFFATDVHGSEICWKKFINAGKFYNVDAIILGGDMTGKALVPFVESGKGTYRVSFLEQEMTLQGDDIERTQKMISDRGYYPIYMTQDRFQELSQDSEKVHQLFVEEVVKTAERWVEYAEERLRQSGIKCFICPGNDDMFELDEVFANSSYIELTEGKVVDIDGTYTMISTGWSNPTPWETHRECSEEELDQKIEAMIPQVPDLNKCIFNFHAPPYGSGLDEAPELDAELRPRYAGRS
ncbi:MAG TPA: metallophosphoesterase, partial [Clostridia bacterium]|nr:metallophosphoesterase [Clostridia bacterium]